MQRFEYRHRYSWRIRQRSSTLISRAWRSTSYKPLIECRSCSASGFTRHVQIKELPTGVGHAADFSDALLKPGFVTREVVADQLAVPVTKEIARRFTNTAWAEAVSIALSAENGVVLSAQT